MARTGCDPFRRCFVGMPKTILRRPRIVKKNLEFGKPGRGQTPRQAEALALGLIDLGIKQGDFVAIIGRNLSLYISMVGIEMAGGVPVPLYQDAVAEEMAYVLGHCGARYVIAGDQEQVDKVLKFNLTCKFRTDDLSGSTRFAQIRPHAFAFYAGILENGREIGRLGRRVKSRETP